ncbi:MAG: hypothetical protein ACLQUY_20090 [Ktedonobacterales bacterium]
MPIGVYERRDQWNWTSTEVLRAKILRASCEILNAGEWVTLRRLRAHGVCGTTNRMCKIREELVASGELPPEAGAHIQERRKVTVPPRPELPPVLLPPIRKPRRRSKLHTICVKLYGRERMRKEYARHRKHNCG